jgi:hypothetical protein
MLQALLICLVVTALLMGLIVLVNLTVPGGEWEYLPLLSFAIALEAVITTRWLNKSGRRINKVVYRAAELAVILIIVRIFTWSIVGQAPDLEKLQGIIISPTSILDLTFIVYALVAFLAWERGAKYGGIFDRLAIDENEIDFFTRHRSDGYSMDAAITVDRNSLLGDFLRSWMIGGLILAFLAMLTTVNLSEINSIGEVAGIRTITRLGLRSEMLLALLVYIFGGLWLASSGRLAALRSRWLIDGLSVSGDVGTIWMRMTLILMAIFAIISAFLPIGSTLAISRILHSIVGLAILILGAIVAIVGWIYFMVARLFLGEMTADEYLELDLADLTPPPPPSAPAPNNEVVAAISGIIFWILMLGIATAAVVFFLRGRGVKLRSNWLWQIWNSIASAWAEFWRGMMQPIASVAITIGHQLRRSVQIDKKGAAPWRFIRLRGLSTREQIRYFYLSTVRRAGQRGVERGQSETPLEYASDLKSGWPEVEGEVDDLTDAFLEARYSRKSIGDNRLGRIKQTWKLVRTAVKKRRKNSS